VNQLPINQVLCGDCLGVLSTLPEKSIDLVVTSPPYWGLRDYGVGNTQLGLEPHPQMFIDHLVEICREIKRVLKNAGTFWLNLGDTYCGSWGNYGTREGKQREQNVEKFDRKGQPSQTLRVPQSYTEKTGWLQPKQLLGIPWRVAIALQHDGWILRNDIIWHKPNHMPSSVKDRLTSAHEHIFLFAKQRHYHFDLDAIRKPYSASTIQRITQPNVMNQRGGDKQRELRGEGGGNASRSADMVKSIAKKHHSKGKNPGDVWKISTKPFLGAHFATFPPRLIEPIVKAGCPKEVCPSCGHLRIKKWVTTPPEKGYVFKRNIGGRTDGFSSNLGNLSEITARYEFDGFTECKCRDGWEPGVVLDPFCGSGTVGQIARKLGRRFILIDIKPEYCEMAEQRIRGKYVPRPKGTPPLTEIILPPKRRKT